MKTAHSFLGSLPVVLLLSLGCSDAADTTDPIGSGGSPSSAGASSSGGVSTAGSGVGTAGSGVGTAGSGVGTAGSGVGTAGSSAGGQNGTSGSGSGGSVGTAGSGQGGSGGSGTVPTDGKGLYDFNCKSCHGEQGVGGPLAPETVHPVREYGTWVVRNGRPLIAPWPKAMEKLGTDKLSDAQLNLIWDYLDQPPQPTTGAALYADYCANCHGADGKGGPATRPLANEGKNVLKLVREGHNIGKYAMRHDAMPQFSTMRITDPELDLILAHVNTFK
ncbi:MAG TPA: c-type cytochrome [Polyangiaceae bacterium]|nr:c-type cytochrome [Polyangiaceae bacterium]